MFWFSVQLLSETFLVLRRIQRDTTTNVHRCSRKVPLFLSDFNETCLFSTDFRSILKYQISWNPYRGSRAVRYGRTERHSEANGRFSQLCEHAFSRIGVCGLPTNEWSSAHARNHDLSTAAEIFAKRTFRIRFVRTSFFRHFRDQSRR